MQYICKYESPLGVMTIASEDDCIVGLWLDRQKYFANTLHEGTAKKELPVFRQAEKWLDCYFKGKAPDVELPLAPKGSVFRQAVWKILCEIPYGQVISYGQIAKRIAEQMGKDTMSAQAVGGAVGHNPISIIIPCHRVIGANGSLTGYAGGLEKKEWLLSHEKAEMGAFYKL